MTLWHRHSLGVIPAKAGIHLGKGGTYGSEMDTRVRGNDLDRDGAKAFPRSFLAHLHRRFRSPVDSQILEVVNGPTTWARRHPRERGNLRFPFCGNTIPTEILAVAGMTSRDGRV
jgi:hypothetical protein